MKFEIYCTVPIPFQGSSVLTNVVAVGVFHSMTMKTY